VAALVAQWRRLGFGHWAVEERESGRFVGRTGAKRHPDWNLDPVHAEVGWAYDRSVWGRGYATEGALAALAFLFDEIGRRDVISIAAPGNAASLRVMDKLGLTRQGERDWGGRGLHVVWYGITREEWAER
jgi:RimJ/RimL family protein N-acetyltransferase